MLALPQHCNLLSLNLAERPAPGVIGGGLSRGQLCRQNRAGPDRLLLMEGRGPSAPYHQTRQGLVRKRARFVVFFCVLFFFGFWYRRAPRSASSPHALLDGTN